MLHEYTWNTDENENVRQLSSYSSSGGPCTVTVIVRLVKCSSLVVAHSHRAGLIYKYKTKPDRLNSIRGDCDVKFRKVKASFHLKLFFLSDLSNH
jgi:hypothetical protein